MKAKHREADLIRVYIETHDFAPIAVADIAGGFAVHVGDQVDWSLPFAAIWWMPDQIAALEMVSGLPLSRDADDAIRNILLAAERGRIRLTEHSTMVDRARGAVALIEKRIQEMQKSGAMSGLNEEYQDHRLFNKEHGRGVKPYWSWLHDRKVEMVKAVALTASGKRPHNPPRPERLDDIPPAPGRVKAQIRAISRPRTRRWT